jgi:hypothetical protein
MSEGFKRLWLVLMVCWWGLLAFPLIGMASDGSPGLAIVVGLFYGVLLPSLALGLLRALGWVFRGFTGTD